MTTTHAAHPATTSPTPHPPTPWSRVVALSVGIGAVVTLALIAFAWPATHAGPHGVSVAVAAPEAAAGPLSDAFDATMPGAFEITAASSPDDVRSQVEAGTVDGGLILGPPATPEVVVASTASPAITQALMAGANAIAVQQAQQLGLDPAPSATVTDVSPMPPGDPRGAAIPSAMLPLFIAGMATGAAGLLVVRRTDRRVALALAAPVVAGLGAVLVLQTWLDALGGSFLAQWGAISLGAAAISLFLVGTVSLLGRAGFGVVAVLMLFLGNPLSAAATGPAFLPAGWAALGQVLPPGAAATTMRDISTYGSAGSSAWTLASWALAGAAMIALGAWRRGHDPLDRVAP